MITERPIEELIGKTFSRVEQIRADEGDEIVFELDGGTYRMMHIQDCCEHVVIEEIHGDLGDLVGTPIVAASHDSNGEDTEDGACEWHLYHLRTHKGTVTLRWYGESNGYYSTRVALYWAPQDDA